MSNQLPRRGADSSLRRGADFSAERDTAQGVMGAVRPMLLGLAVAEATGGREQRTPAVSSAPPAIRCGCAPQASSYTIQSV